MTVTRDPSAIKLVVDPVFVTFLPWFPLGVERDVVDAIAVVVYARLTGRRVQG